MKKLFALLALSGLMVLGTANWASAQSGEPDAMADSIRQDSIEQAEAAAQAALDAEAEAKKAEMAAQQAAELEAAAAKANETRHEWIKSKFIDGGPVFMTLVVICLILGLAVAIERIIYLSMASTNTKKLLTNIEGALQSGGVDAAKEVCRNTRGPVASIFYQGLTRSGEGIEMVEKSVLSYGSVQMGLLEKGVSWISLFIALAPMLGFFGTVLGMIDAFDAIAAANNISPGIVAGGIGVALITTLSGLLVAMILQVFYNVIVAKIDSIVNDMEDASISLVDLLVKYKKA